MLVESKDPTNMRFAWADMKKSNKEGVVFVKKGMKEGVYYIQAFHDENGNMRMDLSPEGVPLEGFGRFPGDARTIPSVEINGDAQDVKLEMIYF